MNLNDYVRNKENNQISKIVSIDKFTFDEVKRFYLENNDSFSENDLRFELWTPQYNELCLFYNSFTNLTVLGNFALKDVLNKYYTIEHVDEFVFDVCVPFIGNKPHWL